MTQLHVRKTESICLKDAIEKCGGMFNSGGVAILYSPDKCQLAKVGPDGQVSGPDNKTINIDLVFEARIFAPDVELRWLNESDGIGSAVLISEKVISTVFDKNNDIEKIDTMPNQYLLWGEADEKQPNQGWTRLSEARIGPIDVPVTGIPPHGHVILKTVEYVKEVDNHGNVAVVEERLSKLEVL